MNTKCYIIKDTGVEINAMYFHFPLDIPALSNPSRRKD